MNRFALTSLGVALVKEPLLHFLLAGAALFGAYAWMSRAAEDASANKSTQIQISAGDVEWLIASDQLATQQRAHRGSIAQIVDGCPGAAGRSPQYTCSLARSPSVSSAIWRRSLLCLIVWLRM